MSTRSRTPLRGFTLVELMVTVVIVAILASLALPAYGRYVFRARLPVGTLALVAYQMRLEQAFQDTGRYGTEDSCGASLPVAPNFNFTCRGSADGQSYLATAIGVGPLVGVTYTIDQLGNHATPLFPWGRQNLTCWTLRGDTCDE